MAAAIMFLFCLALYFLPTIVACLRSKRNTGAIFVTNLIVGWTFIGWVIPLIWAFTYEPPRSIIE